MFKFFFRRPQSRALIATFFTAMVLFLGISGVLLLIKNYPDQTLAALLGFGLTWFMYASYQRYLEHYKKLDDYENL
jgi:zinc transporter ZupT